MKIIKIIKKEEKLRDFLFFYVIIMYMKLTFTQKQYEFRLWNDYICLIPLLWHFLHIISFNYPNQQNII